MVNFEVVNELALRVTMGPGDEVFTKAGAFVMGENYGQKNYQFEKVLLGPQGNPVQALVGQLVRRFTGENLPLMKVKSNGDSLTYYANQAQHVVAYKLKPGEKISVESENILAFTKDCKYSVRFLAQGVISQKGLATSTLEYDGPNAYVAILMDGNPLSASNVQNGSTIEVDPDAVVAWIGADPGFKLDISWKNIIGQASGETYMFEWDESKRATVILQPNERKSGLDISMDGSRTGQQASRQNNQSARQATSEVSNAINAITSALGVGSGLRSGGGSGLGGLGGGLEL